MERWDGWWLVCFHFLGLSLSRRPLTRFLFSLHPSSLWLSSLPGLIMNCLCFPSHFPACPLVWSPLLILHLTCSPSLYFISPNSRPWMAPAWAFSFVHPGTQGNSALFSLLLFSLPPTRPANPTADAHHFYDVHLSPSSLLPLSISFLITGQFCLTCSDALILLICLL